MKTKEENFVLTVEDIASPVIITVPHGGLKNGAGSWLDFAFTKRVKSTVQSENYIQGEKIVLGGDGQILHVVSDVLKQYSCNLIAGLLPREFVDYNRFVPEVAYADNRIKPLYDAYHLAVETTITKLQKIGKKPILFDMHGFGKQPIEGCEFDVVLGTNDGESDISGNASRLLYRYLKTNTHYHVFCSGQDGMPLESDLYRGDTTNFHYAKKYGIDGVLVEIAPKFRSSVIDNSKQNGQKLAEHLAHFMASLS